MATVTLNPSSLESYRQFVRIKQLPSWSVRGRVASFPDEYAGRFEGVQRGDRSGPVDHELAGHLFDYQRDISKLAIAKRKFAIFADCGLGKTMMFIEFAKAANSDIGSQRGVLIVSPLMVVQQTIDEARRWYPYWPVEYVKAAKLQSWLDDCGGRIGITNYEAIKDDLSAGRLGALILDESSMLKSHYGKWGTKLIELGRGLDWKLCGTGTPAPNDRIEYANHSVFLDQFPTTNAFLATFFVNRGQTQERWVLKDHAIGPFYRHLSHWCIFLSDPSVYGWKDNTDTIPPIKVHIHDVPLTAEQRKAYEKMSGRLFAGSGGGITSRSKMAQIAKGKYGDQRLATGKPGFIRDLVAEWSDSEQTIIWCVYNHEQDEMERVFPDAVSIRGETPLADRLVGISEFQEGSRRVLISKPKVLGFGLNLQCATRQVFSGLQDSYESYYQAVKRSNRIGSTKPLNVHIPVTDLEQPMVQNVMRKADRVTKDTLMQQRLFREHVA